MPWCVRKINQACGHFHHGVDVRENRNKRITKITLNDDALGILNCILKCFAGLINSKGMNGNLFFVWVWIQCCCCNLTVIERATKCLVF